MRPIPRARRLALSVRKSSSSTEFRIDAAVVADVVAVWTALARREDRRAVAVGDAETVEIADHPLDVGEPHVAAQLDAVGRRGRTHSGNRPIRVQLDCHRELRCMARESTVEAGPSLARSREVPGRW